MKNLHYLWCSSITMRYVIFLYMKNLHYLWCSSITMRYAPINVKQAGGGGREGAGRAWVGDLTF